jgi:hypothetical protein
MVADILDDRVDFVLGQIGTEAFSKRLEVFMLTWGEKVVPSPEA